MRELRDAFASFARPLPEPHLLVAAGGRVVALNPAASRALGVDDPPPAGLSLLDLAESPETAGAYLRACAATGSLRPGALTLRGAEGKGCRWRCEGAALRPPGDGGEAPVLLRLRPHLDATRRFLLLNRKIEELAREIHERRRAEDELQLQAVHLEESTAELELLVDELERQKEEAQSANRAKTEFLAVMSHELRTPLNAIVGYADLLGAEVDGPLTDGQRERLARIDRSARHLVAIIDEILGFSRLDSGRERPDPEPVDLVRVAREAAELAEPSVLERGLAISLRLPDAPVPAETDPTHVRQILLNLLSNAVRFTPDGEVAMTMEADGSAARISVADTGIGIDPEHLERIFEPFWQVERGMTRRFGGAGLGLAVTRGLARTLGGEVVVRSEPGVGSTFTVVLPRRTGR